MTAGSRRGFRSDVERRPARTTGRFVTARPPAVPSGGMNGAIVFTIAAALVAAVGLLYLLQTNHVAGLGYEMSRLQQIREEQAVENQRLKSTLAEHRTLGHIRNVAVNEHGMEPVEEYRFVTVPRPAEAEIATPPPVEAESPSVWGRFWQRLTGRGEAVNSTEREAQP